jgi:outer membrane protein TolC
MKTRKRRFFFLFTVLFIPLFFIGQVGFSYSITLEDAAKMALANNEQVLSVQASLEIARLNLKRAQKLFATPHINLNFEPWQGKYDIGRETYQGTSELMMSGTIKFSQGTDIGLNYQGAYDYEKGGYDDFYTLELHQSLFQDQSLTPSALELYNARMAAEKAYLTLEDIEKEIILSAVRSFYKLREIGNSLSLTTERIALSQEKLAETIEKKDFGLTGELDVLRAKIELAENIEQLNELENQLALTKDQFFHSIGIEKDASLIFSLIKEKKLREKAEELLAKEISQEIVSSQSELKRAQWTVDEKRLQLSKKEEELSPGWSLTIGYTSERSISGGVVPAQSEAKIGVTYNLFDGGRAKLSMQAAEMELEKAEGNLKNLKKTAQFSLSSEKNVLREALSRFNLWKLKKDEIELKGDLAQEQFTLGIISSQELKEFQLQTVQVENSYQSALHNLLTSYFSYRLSLGINIDFDEVIGK